MHPIPADRLRDALLNASKRERASILLPDVAATPWNRLDYLGWRDPKQPLLGAVVADVDGETVGVLLRQAERTPRSRAQCSWCEDVQLPNDVVFFSAKRTGEAGRRGDTVGILVCANFECSANVRRLPPLAYTGFDREAERQRRIDGLRDHVTAFIRAVRDGT